MKAFGIVILSHILSRISSPESGRAMARTMVGMSIFTVSWISSNGPRICTEVMSIHRDKTYCMQNQNTTTKMMSHLHWILLMTSWYEAIITVRWKINSVYSFIITFLFRVFISVPSSFDLEHVTPWFYLSLVIVIKLIHYTDLCPQCICHRKMNKLKHMVKFEVLIMKPS
jgi:hypothetical protein